MSEIDLRLLAAERFEEELKTAWQKKDFPAAMLLSRELLALREVALGADAPGVIDLLCDMAELHRLMRELNDCERLLTVALLAEENRGVGSRQGRVAFQLAQLWLERGDAEQALPLVERAAAMAAPEERVVAYGSFATVLRSLGRQAEARTAAEHALTACDPKRTPPVHAAQAHALMGEICEESGELAHAHSLYIAAHDLYQLGLGDHHPQVAIALLNVVTLAHQQGLDPTPDAQRVLAIMRGALGHDNPQTLAVHRALVALLGAQVAGW